MEKRPRGDQVLCLVGQRVRFGIRAPEENEHYLGVASGEGYEAEKIDIVEGGQAFEMLHRFESSGEFTIYMIILETGPEESNSSKHVDNENGELTDEGWTQITGSEMVESTEWEIVVVDKEELYSGDGERLLELVSKAVLLYEAGSIGRSGLKRIYELIQEFEIEEEDKTEIKKLNEFVDDNED